MTFASHVFAVPREQDATARPVVLALRGWVCDRYTDAGMRGSLLLAQAAATKLRVPLLELGKPEQAVDLGWQDSLAKTTPYLREVSAYVDAVMTYGRKPLIFANRCGAGLATIAAALRRRPDAKVVWFDAHGDFNTPQSSPTGYLGGMVLTALCGLWDSGLGAGLTPDRIVLVGQRDLDPQESLLIAKHGVTLIAAPHGHLNQARLLEAVGGAPIWLHIDTDVIDPLYLPAEYRVHGGLHPNDVRAAIAALVQTSELVGFELTEFETPLDEVSQHQALDTIMNMIAPVLEQCGGGG
ncbi:MAG: arginase family protein [Beijerinckiaceae bacterium]